MELTSELNSATCQIEIAVRHYFEKNPHETPLSLIALQSGCELFIRSVTRQFLELRDFDVIKEKMTKRGHSLARLSETSRKTISKQLQRFVTHDCSILVFGYSRAIIEALVLAAKHARFQVFVPQCYPSNLGTKTAKLLLEANIPTRVITDASIAHYMSKVHFMLTGAESVVENGGIINTVGTYQATIVAQLYKKPVYVLAESFKFVRFYPLNQDDIDSMEYINRVDGVETMSKNKHEIPTPTPVERSSGKASTTRKGETFPHAHSGKSVSGDNTNTITVDNLPLSQPNADFTPPQYITLLFTDLGILTPSGISDELIKLYT